MAFRPAGSTEAMLAERRHRAAPKLHDAALALAVDGTVLLNVVHAADVDLHRTDTVAHLLRCALEEADDVFIGVPLRGLDRAEALRRLANGAADAAGHVVGQRRRRVRERKS